MITKEKTNVRNGVNVDQLFDTVKLVQEQPEIGKFEFRAKSKWINGGHCVTSAKNYYGAGQEFTDREEAFTMEADHPPVLLGEDKAPTPAEIVLHGLGTCLIGAMMYHAAANGIDIQSAEASLEGDVDLQGFLGIDQDV
ncbi:MAG: OsmC family protein, partial [Flavobacteriaceae bacterium]|nr:OsmC family protein [Flavobacteriaceae bacterium]